MANSLAVEIRKAKNPREMRRSGQIPAVVYGPEFHKEISIPRRELDMILARSTRSSKIDLTVDGETYAVFIKDIQYHPLNDSILHVDFFKPAEGQIIKMEIPVKFIGEPKGRRKGGATVKVRDFVELKGPAQMIPEIFETDITDIDVGGKIRAGDLELPESTELVTTPDVLLLQVVIPRRAKAEDEEAAESEEGEAAEAAAGAEGQPEGESPSEESSEE